MIPDGSLSLDANDAEDEPIPAVQVHLPRASPPLTRARARQLGHAMLALEEPTMPMVTLLQVTTDADAEQAFAAALHFRPIAPKLAPFSLPPSLESFSPELRTTCLESSSSSLEHSSEPSTMANNGGPNSSIKALTIGNKGGVPWRAKLQSSNPRH